MGGCKDPRNHQKKHPANSAIYRHRQFRHRQTQNQSAAYTAPLWFGSADSEPTSLLFFQFQVVCLRQAPSRLCYAMDPQELTITANKLAAPGKGLLASDESTPTIGKRLVKAGLINDEVCIHSNGEVTPSGPVAMRNACLLLLLLSAADGVPDSNRRSNARPLGARTATCCTLRPSAAPSVAPSCSRRPWGRVLRMARHLWSV